MPIVRPGRSISSTARSCRGQSDDAFVPPHPPSSGRASIPSRTAGSSPPRSRHALALTRFRAGDRVFRRSFAEQGQPAPCGSRSRSSATGPTSGGPRVLAQAPTAADGQRSPVSIGAMRTNTRLRPARLPRGEHERGLSSGFGMPSASLRGLGAFGGHNGDARSDGSWVPVCLPGLVRGDGSATGGRGGCTGAYGRGSRGGYFRSDRFERRRALMESWGDPGWTRRGDPEPAEPAASKPAAEVTLSPADGVDPIRMGFGNRPSLMRRYRLEDDISARCCTAAPRSKGALSQGGQTVKIDRHPGE